MKVKTFKVDESNAYIIVYHWGVYERGKDSSHSYLGFRVAKAIKN